MESSERAWRGVPGSDTDVVVDVHDGKEWYTFKRGENASWLVEQAGIDMAKLRELNPHVDLSTTFPGDRVVISSAQDLKPSYRTMVAVVGQPTPTAFVAAKSLSWSSPLAYTGVLIAGIITGAAFSGRGTKVSAMFTSIKSTLDSDVKKKNEEITNLQTQRDAVERELGEAREKWQRNERSIFNLQQLLESATKSDASLKEQISLLKGSLDSKNVDYLRLETSNAKGEELLEQYKRDLANSEAELDALQEAVHNSAFELKDTKSQAVQYEKQAQAYREKVIDMESELMALRGISDEYSDEALAAKEAYKQTLSEIASLKDVNDKLERALTKESEQVTLALNQLDTYRKDMERLELELAASRDDVSELTANITSANTQVGELESELETSRLEASAYSSDLISVKEELKAAMSELETVKSDLQSFQSHQQTQVSEYDESIKLYQAKLSEAESTLQNAQNEANSHIVNLSATRDELKGVREELSSIVNELKAVTG